jgi:hypothetical protein
MNFINTMQEELWNGLGTHGTWKVQSCLKANNAACENNIHCHKVNTEWELQESYAYS